METIFDKASVWTVMDLARLTLAGGIVGFTLGLLVASTLKL